MIAKPGHRSWCLDHRFRKGVGGDLPWNAALIDPVLQEVLGLGLAGLNMLEAEKSFLFRQKCGAHCCVA